MNLIRRVALILKLKQRDKFFALANSALGSIVRFASGVAIARLGGAADFADYVLYSTLLFLGTGLSASCIENPMLNLAPGLSSSQRNALIRWKRKRSMAVALTVTLVGLATSTILYLGKIDCRYFLIGTAVAVSAILAQFHRTRLLAIFKAKTALIADLSIPVIIVGYLLLFGNYSESANEAYWIAFAFGSLSSAFIMALAKPIPLAGEPSETCKRQANESGKMMLLGSSANSACARTHPLIVKSIAGSNTLAEFGAAWTLLGPIRLVAVAYANLLRPRLSLFHGQKDDTRLSRVIALSQVAIAFVGLILGFSLLIAGPTIGRLFFGPAIQLSGILLLFATLYATIDALTSLQMIRMQITLNDGAKRATRLRILSACISIATVFPLCLQFGAGGAIASLLIAESVYFCLALRSGSEGRNIDFSRGRFARTRSSRNPKKLTELSTHHIERKLSVGNAPLSKPAVYSGDR